MLRLHNGKAERVDVTLGMRDDRAGLIQVTNGVTSGDTLLVAAAAGDHTRNASSRAVDARGPVEVASMFISDFAIKRPIVTIVVMVALVIFGIFALVRTDVDEFPDIANPIVFVSVPYPGASPDQVEREVIDRMEESFQGLNGIDQITSTSTDGFAQIIVQFKFTKGVDEAAQDVRDAISGIRDKLPVEMKEPIIQKLDPNDLPIVSLTLSSKVLTPNELTILADPGITRQLQGLNGVSRKSR